MTDEWFDSLCGYFIRGNPMRPCAVSRGHYGVHKDFVQKGHGQDTASEFAHYIAARGDTPLIPALCGKPMKRIEGVCGLKAGHKSNCSRNVLPYTPSAYVQHREQWTPNRSWVKRRARLAEVPHVDYSRTQLIELYGSDCYLCRKPLPDNWEVEHIIPISRGGWDVPINLRPACPSCNLRKSAKMPPAIVVMRVWYELGLHRAGWVCELESLMVRRYQCTYNRGLSTRQARAGRRSCLFR